MSVTKAYRSKPTYVTLPRFAGISYQRYIRWGPTLGLWGAGAVLTLLYFAEPMPDVRRDLLSKMPIFGSYWDRPIAPEDNPY
ncbi:hypothetical protein CANCADRAFT_29624 [Tortispora caseinolytica NRRL Y-17796]|uniref:Uncharacterized protein n=1 Tax=Tortispora caseinolytica NRRL Y-17796 TaxID=767744 RepID=A0A1E4T9I2_9ASCO|nr:hypothetical protein CANCADRAFT_29624 [Tortispora caseinolytica NRRL Y-17796]